ncbi:hypothetical protein [uncultured Anaerotruncus sp.]|uniref:hypothetical protein n=1 Tax=uncultured Anaerotruncus sp. TaxID=905011 RepID=UPI0025842F05|nr:hypothetical protein [uncultured Anaerotruncus sp.]
MKEKRKQALRRALRQGPGGGAGIMLGGALIPRLAMPGRYNDTWPPLALHCALYFLAAGLVALAGSCLAAFLEERKRRRG